MSASFVLLPLAVALITSSMEGVGRVVDSCQRVSGGCSDKIETRFNSEDLLKKTLAEYGASFQNDSPDRITADFKTGKIVYERKDSTSPYTMQVFDVKDLDCLIDSIKAIDEEYGCNVQSYTYHKMMQNLPENMRLESDEVLEDGSILITLTVDL